MSAADITAIEGVLSVLIERAGLTDDDRAEIKRRCAMPQLGTLEAATFNAVDRMFSGAGVLAPPAKPEGR